MAGEKTADMEIRRGIPVSPGVAIGAALVLGTEDFRIPQRFVKVAAVESELLRFRTAVEAACSEIAAHEELARSRLGSQYSAIFGAHLQLARDPKLIREIEDLICERNYSPEFASSKVLRKYAKTIQGLGDRYLAERAADLFDVEKRILRFLLGEKREELKQLTEPVIVLAHNLSPSETASLDKRFVLAFATEVGGKSSHTAILAGALEIPAIVGVGNFLSDISGGDQVIIDGDHGEVIINPDDATLERFQASARLSVDVSSRRSALAALKPETLDGVTIQLNGNIEFPEEVDACLKRGADGIGLYRTEFLYLSGDREPSEEDHFQAYRHVAETLAGKPVVIRTLDLGADKISSSTAALVDAEANPSLGLRSVRLSLKNIALFKTQLRAALRAREFGQIRLMFPLVSTLLELRQAKMILADVIEDLHEEGIAVAKDIRVGMMVEVPSAALMAAEFAQEVDFFSIGTNDLIQYTLAVDRANPSVAHLYSSADPSLLRLIRVVVAAAREHNIPVAVCGQMSSDPMYAPLLLGMGLRELSVTPQSIPDVKQVIRSISIPQAEEIARHAQLFDVARDVESYLRGELKKLCPELVV